MAQRSSYRHDRRRQRSVPRTLWAFLQIVGHVVAPWRRGGRVRWGARPDEPDPARPGERLIADPSWASTHAVSIDAPVADVWPWIAQLGQGRGGFYSFERLENLVGCRVTNTDAILPDHQDIAVGDEVRLHVDGPPMEVVLVEPGRSLVLLGSPSETGNEALWAFHLMPDGAERCRLVERGIYRHGTSLTDRLLYSPLLIEPIGFVMSREMLLGIKERAERR